jgi:hypothetical protein
MAIACEIDRHREDAMLFFAQLLDVTQRLVALPYVKSTVSVLLALFLGLLLPGCTPSSTPDTSLSDLYDYRASSLDELRAGFTNPPRQAGPWVYWFWFENVVNRENITRELGDPAKQR